MTKIAVLVGSLQKDSVNRKLAKNLEKLAPEGVEFNYVDTGSLPLFNQDLESDLPSSVIEMKSIIDSADGILLVTPEYNRSFSGVLKNAIDWASRPYGSNSFEGKPTGIVGATISALGTAPAQAGLRQMMVHLGTKLMGQPEVYLSVTGETFDENGDVTEASKGFLEAYVKALAAHVDANK